MISLSQYFQVFEKFASIFSPFVPFLLPVHSAHHKATCELFFVISIQKPPFFAPAKLLQCLDK